MLDKIAKTIDDYVQNKDNPEVLLESLKTLASSGYYLANEMADQKIIYNSKVMRFMGDGDSATMAEKRAKNETAELQRMKILIPQVNKTQDAIRTQISWLKHEMNN